MTDWKLLASIPGSMEADLTNIEPHLTIPCSSTLRQGAQLQVNGYVFAYLCTKLLSSNRQEGSGREQRNFEPTS